MAWTKEDRSFKTLINRRTTDSTGKYWYNEYSDSTLNVHISEVWTDTIDSSPAQAVTDGVAEQRTLFALTLDGSVPSDQCYYAYETGARLKDWISTKYGEDYIVHLYDNANAEIFPTDACQWFFDYQTGILTFNGSTSAFSKPFKISGYRYIGSKGSGGTGTSGTSGSSGTSGTSGINGVDGTSGTSGVNGIDGTSGTSGEAGADGTSGTSGINGLDGTSGSSGTSGEAGDAGTSGTSGTSGEAGEAGTSGTSGTSGEAGEAGTSGTSGINGVDGTSGTSGINGVDGTSGTSGVNGADGTSGTSGTSGEQGDAGTSGTSGTSGEAGEAGTSGTSGTSGEQGDAGTSGTSGTSGEAGEAGTSGSSGSSGTSGAGDGSMLMGELPSGEVYDGLVDITETDQVNQAINWINEMLEAIAPAKPGNLTSSALTLSGTTKYSAKLPSGLASDWYGGSASAGDTITDYVVDNTFTLTSPAPTTSFYNGQNSNPGGTLSLYGGLAGTTLLDSLSTASTGSSTLLTVSDVSTYNSIWSKANAYAAITQSSEGYRSYTFQHTLAGNSNATTVRYDDVNTTPTFSTALSVAENSVQSKYLSGIEYYGVNTTLDITYTIASGIFTKCYHPTAVAIVSQNVGAFASFNQNPAATPAYNDTFAVSSYTVTLNVASRSSNLPTITVTAQKPNGTTAASSANLAKKVCTYGTVSTTTAEYFFDEAQRLVAGTDTAWTSTTALVSGEAQVRNGYLQFPNSTEYSGFSGDQEYQRKFTKASASTGTLTFGGITYTNVSSYGTGSLNILLYLDTDAVWFDLGRVVGDNNGDGTGSSRANSKGARVSGSSGAISWSIGTYSTSNNSSQFRLVIIFKNTTYSITSIVSA